MDPKDQRARPLLLGFMRPQPAPNIAYRYDEAQRLNLTSDGTPIVAAGGRALLKTQAVVDED